MQNQVHSQGQSIPIPLQSNQSQACQQLLPQNVPNNMATAGVPSVSGLTQNPTPNVVGQNSNMQSMSGMSEYSLRQGMPSNIFTNQQMQMQGTQQMLPQQQQQHLYHQQLQHQLMKQKIQQGNLQPSLMQPHMQQQQQQYLLPPTQLQSSQQSGMQPPSIFLICLYVYGTIFFHLNYVFIILLPPKISIFLMCAWFIYLCYHL